MTAKRLYVHELVTEVLPRLIWLRDHCPELYGTYFDMGYNAGGADPIADEDISMQYAFGAAGVASFITLLENLIKLLSSDTSAVTNADYASTINKLRFGKIA